MDSVFTTLDLVIFLGCLILVMGVGIVAGRKEGTAEDFYLAGRKIKWWGVAGSIFGSNVSANHLVGMMGIGFSVGFAQSHFELGAIAGLMMLCYGFLPVYRKLNVYTLSEYLERRFDQRSRFVYALIMLIIMGLVQLGPALYIGSRSTCVLLGGKALEQQSDQSRESSCSAEEENDNSGGVATSNADSKKSQMIKVNKDYYTLFVVLMALTSASYTILGGLKAVVFTDVIQSGLLLIAGIVLALFVFTEIGGWDELMALDAAAGDQRKMGLYLPSYHIELPWIGVFTGLMLGHTYYWGTNQFIVQRTLGAQSDSQARFGIIIAGFGKLLIPFFAIAAGVAAFYLFKQNLDGRPVAPDTAFTEAVRNFIPPGIGIVGLIAAGLIGAILSSVDSMMNSAATVFTVDIYKRYLKPQASDRDMILVGRIFIVVLVVMASTLAIFVLDPNSEKNFFLQIVNYQTYFIPGMVSTFLLGMFWWRGTATAAFATIIGGVVFSMILQTGYNRLYGDGELANAPNAFYVVAATASDEEVAARFEHLKDEDFPKDLQNSSDAAQLKWLLTKSRDLSGIARLMGPQLHFFYRSVGVTILCAILFVAISLFEQPHSYKSRMIWTDLGGHNHRTLLLIVAAITMSLCVYTLFAVRVHAQTISPVTAGVSCAVWTCGMFLASVLWSNKGNRSTSPLAESVLKDDRTYAGILCGFAVFMLFYFV